MSEAVILALIQFATKFGIDAALALIPALKPGATIDDAIAALSAANAKSLAAYKAEAKGRDTATP